MKNYFIIALLSLIFSTAEAQNRSVNLAKNEPLEKILKQAKKEKKLVFLDFGSPRCKPCLHMKHNIFTIDSVADFVNKNFVCCDYTEGNEKKRLSKIYNVYSEPVFILLDANGNLMHRTEGSSTAQEMLDRFKQGMDKENNLVALNKKYAAGNRNPEFLYQYIETLHIAGLRKEKAEVLGNIFSKDFNLENLKDAKYWNIFLRYDDSPVSRQSKYVVENRKVFCDLYGDKIVHNKLNRTFGGAARSYIFGAKPPREDADFADVLKYAQMCDYEGSRDWLLYLVPAQYKYSDWVAMAKEIDNAIAFNVANGNDKKMYMRMMSEQLYWYCDNKEALAYALKWIDSLMPYADDATKISITETREGVVKKMSAMI